MGNTASGHIKLPESGVPPARWQVCVVGTKLNFETAFWASAPGRMWRSESKVLASSGALLLPKLGAPARCPFSPLVWGKGSPTKIDYIKKGTLILSSQIRT